MEENQKIIQFKILHSIAGALNCKVENEFPDINSMYKCYSEWAHSFVIDNLLKSKTVRKLSVYWENDCVKKLRIICIDDPYILYSMKDRGSFDELTIKYQIPNLIEALTELCQLDICTIGVGFSKKIWCLGKLVALNVYCPNPNGIDGWVGNQIALKHLSLFRPSFPYNISLLTDLETFDLNGCKESYLPPEYFSKNRKLKKVSLVSASLQMLPSSAYELSDLQFLNLESSSIRMLSSQISKLKNLHRLYLKGTKIDFLPETISDCISLKELTLPKQLKTLPVQIGNLVHLTDLNLEDTDIQVLPGSITNLRNLKRLSLPKSLTILPESIGLLKQLRTLNMHACAIDYLPDSIGDLIFIRNISFPKGLQLLPHTIGNLQNLLYLNLLDTRLETLPESIGNMVQLTKVTLPASLRSLPESIQSLKNIKKLDLGETQLEELPEGLGGMTGLEHVSFPPKLKKLPESIVQLKKLKELDLYHTQLHSLPEDIGFLREVKLFSVPKTITWLPESVKNFRLIERLELKHTKMSFLPEGISDLVNVKEISFPAALERLPDRIGNLSHIKRLNLQHTKIKELPESILYLSNLEELRAPKTLEKLPSCMGKLTNLAILDLKYTEIKTLPDDIGRLGNLTCLYLSHSKIEKLPSILQGMQNLRELYLDHTEIKYLPSEICKLQCLEQLHLENSKLLGLPKNIGLLPSLQTLDISNTRLRLIPDSVEHFCSTSFKLLNMRGLTLDYVSRGLARLILRTYKKSFYHSKTAPLHNVKILNQDATLFECPPDVIESFYADPLVRLNECKVIFLGDGNVGKSSLIDRIIDNSYRQNRPVTNGISIRKWQTPINKQTVNIRFWDFGGQEIMHTMHLCFLTQRTVYVIVLDSRQDQYLEKIAIDWLQTVNSFAPDTPIILVLNKCDMNRSAMLNLASLKESYPGLIDCVRTSAFRGTNIDALKKLISFSIRKYSSYSTVFNQKWVGIKTELENMQQPYISNQTYTALCDKYGITEESLQISLLSFFKDLGVTYHYSDYDLKYDPDAINVLNPEWVTNGIYRLILHAKAENGFITQKEIRHVLATSYRNDVSPHLTYTRYEATFILDVMREKGLSLEQNKKELIPMKLNYFSPRIDDILDPAKAKILHFAIKGDYLPESIIHKLIIDRIDEVDLEEMWRNGVSLYNKVAKAKAVIILRYESRYRLDIYIQSHSEVNEKVYLDTLHENILKLLKQINITNYEEVICYHLANGMQGEEPYARVLKPYLHGVETIYLPSSDHFISPATLLNTVHTKHTLKNTTERPIIVNKFYAPINQFNQNSTVFGDANNNSSDKTLDKCEEIAKKIRLISGITDEQYNELLSLLAPLQGNDELSPEQKNELAELAEQGNNSKNGWEKARNYLSDTANLVTIFSVLPTIAVKIYELLF